MRSLFAEYDRREILLRLESLRPDSPRQWGRMSVAQMVVHVGHQLSCGLGELTVKPIPHIGRYNPIRWAAIYWLPIPKNVPTAPELVMPAVGEWEADRELLRSLIGRFVAKGERGTWADHPIFGPMSGRDWGVLAWKHLDHHFRQFGV